MGAPHKAIGVPVISGAFRRKTPAEIYIFVRGFTKMLNSFVNILPKKQKARRVLSGTAFADSGGFFEVRDETDRLENG